MRTLPPRPRYPRRRTLSRRAPWSPHGAPRLWRPGTRQERLALLPTVAGACLRDTPLSRARRRPPGRRGPGRPAGPARRGASALGRPQGMRGVRRRSGPLVVHGPEALPAHPGPRLDCPERASYSGGHRCGASQGRRRAPITHRLRRGPVGRRPRGAESRDAGMRPPTPPDMTSEPRAEPGATAPAVDRAGSPRYRAWLAADRQPPRPASRGAREPGWHHERPSSPTRGWGAFSLRRMGSRGAASAGSLAVTATTTIPAPSAGAREAGRKSPGGVLAGDRA
jgi:hypothetical protein